MSLRLKNCSSHKESITVINFCKRVNSIEITFNMYEGAVCHVEPVYTERDLPFYDNISIIHLLYV